MVKRISLVWKHPELSDAEFRGLWLGEHVGYARQLPGVRHYSIDFITEGPAGAPAAIATLRFDSRAALDAAFSDPVLRENLRRTREQFAARVEVMLVEECPVVYGKCGALL
jgi:uncharacterized protein (TIGR02118 family)